jgi:hypothetical protein
MSKRKREHGGLGRLPTGVQNLVLALVGTIWDAQKLSRVSKAMQRLVQRTPYTLVIPDKFTIITLTFPSEGSDEVSYDVVYTWLKKYTQIKSLTVHNCYHFTMRLGEFLQLFKTLHHLSLSNLGDIDDIVFLEPLRFLQTLSLNFGDSIRQMESSKLPPSLESVELFNFRNLLSIDDENRLNKVKRLVIVSCAQLVQIPKFNNLVEEIEVAMCKNDIIISEKSMAKVKKMKFRNMTWSFVQRAVENSPELVDLYLGVGNQGEIPNTIELPTVSDIQSLKDLNLRKLGLAYPHSLYRTVSQMMLQQVWPNIKLVYFKQGLLEDFNEHEDWGENVEDYEMGVYKTPEEANDIKAVYGFTRDIGRLYVTMWRIRNSDL